MKKLLLKFVLSLFMALPVSAKDNTLELTSYGSFLHSEKVPDALFFFSKIEKNDSFELRKALRNHKINKIVLSSRGGSVFEGLQMAGIIHDKGLTTYIPKKGLDGSGNCASACAFMFFGGNTRVIGGKLGVHQFYSQDSKAKVEVTKVEKEALFTVSEIIGFLNEFETPPFVFEKMFQQSDMYYFTKKEVSQLQSNVSELQNDNIKKIEMFIENLIKEINKDTIVTALNKKNDAVKKNPVHKKKCTNNAKHCADKSLCVMATYGGAYGKLWSVNPQNKKYVTEAKARGLACGVPYKVSEKKCYSDPKQCKDIEICKQATFFESNSIKKWNASIPYYNKYVIEAKARGLTCGVISNFSNENCAQDARQCANSDLCKMATNTKNSIRYWSTTSYYRKYADEAKRRGFKCGVEETKKINKSVIKGIQSKLNFLNCKAGPADGAIGKRTLSALLRWKAVGGNYHVGEINYYLFEKLSKSKVSCQYHGYNEVSYNDGSFYKGNFLKGRYHGHGILKYADGSIYDGKFVRNKIQGYGKFKYPNGDVYEGNFKDGTFHTYGKFRWINGDVYMGNWVNGERTGQGKYTWANGQTYNGPWKNGRMLR